MTDYSLESTILGLEHHTWKALQQEGRLFLEFLDPDCIMLFPLGMKISMVTHPSIKDVMTSEAFVPWRHYSFDDVVVLPVGIHGAVISYRVEATRIGAEDEPFKALISSTWRRDPDSGVWRSSSYVKPKHVAVTSGNPFSFKQAMVPVAELVGIASHLWQKFMVYLSQLEFLSEGVV